MGRTGGGSSLGQSHIAAIYSANPKDYQLLEEVGYGASATVYRAIYIPFNHVVAIKCLDLDRCSSNLDDIRREAQTMSLIDHPNVVKAYCSFVVERNLWVVMPFMAEGSCLHLMKVAYPNGFEEAAICSILKESLKALHYLHQQGHIHRDVKAGNILLDSDGIVKLADFGVSACMFDTGERQHTRNTFVGTPCWMAPEVLQPGSGYNSKADIWSFGITALELAHGHAPFSKYPPMKVLLMTIQNAPPGLDYDRDKKFSKSFKEMVAMCLVKDQTKRPTAEKLLKLLFFKNAKPPEHSLKKLFADLPPLWHRVKSLQLKDATQLALKKMPSAEQEALSQSEYQRGVSAWNFDIDDLKFQASLVRDVDMMEVREDDEGAKFLAIDKDANDKQSSLGMSINNNLPQIEFSMKLSGEAQQVGLNKNVGVLIGNLEESIVPNNILKKNGSMSEGTSSASEKDVVSTRSKNQVVKSRQTQSGPLVPAIILSHPPVDRSQTNDRFGNENRPFAEKFNSEMSRAPNFSGPLMLPNRASANSLSAPIKSSGGFRDSLDDKSKSNLVQIKGRFSVTSENLDLVKDIPISSVPRRSSQGSPMRKSASVGDWTFDSKPMPINQSTKESSNMNISASFLMPHLHNLFQQTSIQQDLIMNILNSFQPIEAIDAYQNEKLPPQPLSSEINGSSTRYAVAVDKALLDVLSDSSAILLEDDNHVQMDMTASGRERSLLLKISELQTRMMTLTDELTAEKLKYTQLQQQLNAISSQEQNGDRREGVS